MKKKIILEKIKFDEIIFFLMKNKKTNEKRNFFYTKNEEK